MSDSLLDLQAAVATWEDVARRRPLTLWRAWGDPAGDSVQPVHGAPVTQRRMLVELQSHKVVVAFGGNRSGKTEWCRAANVALALGSDHPDAIAFWRANGCDPDRFPRGPGRVWAIARRSSDSIRYHRRQYLSLCPRWGPAHPSGSRGESVATWNLDGRGESHIEVMVPGYDVPAEIWFKSEDQDPDSFDGDAIRAAHHDEEGRSPKVWDQVKYRLIDYDGWQMLSNAPIKGRTWVYSRFEVRGEPDARVLRLYSIHNPYLPPKLAAKLHEDPVRGRGEFVVAKGRIWPAFGVSTHVIPRREWPDHWPRYSAIDFGLRDPHARLWAVLTRSRVELEDGRVIPDRSLVVYREHYRAGWTLAQHVQHYRRVEGWEEDPERPGVWRRTPTTERIQMTWVDPEDAQQALSLGRDHGLTVMRAIKSREAGIGAVAEWLTPDATGWPRLWVTEDCPETIREWSDYVELETLTSEGVPTHRPSERSDHTCDCARYLVMGVRAGL